MQVLRLHDPGRRPASWSEIIQSRQFAAFAKSLDTGTPSDADGRGFAVPSDSVCYVFDSLDEARAFCEASVNRASAVQFEIFDAAGRSNPPLLTVVHPSRSTGDTDPSALRRRQLIAWTLIVLAIPTLVLAYRLRDGGHQIFAGFIGLNLLVAAGRLLWFNLALRETEDVRRKRMAAAAADGTDRP